MRETIRVPSLASDTGEMAKQDVDVLRAHRPPALSLIPGSDSHSILKRVLKGPLTEPQMDQLREDIQDQIRGKSISELDEVAEILRDCAPEGVRKPEIREDFEASGILWGSFRIPNTEISISMQVMDRRCVVTITEAGVSMYVEVCCNEEDDFYSLYCD